jgi:phosphatidylglycerophosphatase A
VPEGIAISEAESPLPLSAARVFRDPVLLPALGFGAGLARRAPGTAGTLIGIPVHLAIAPLAFHFELAVVLGIFLIGIPLCGSAARRLGVHDHPAIVWDEIVGYLVTMLAAPAGWTAVIAGFVLFRFFDIIKPPPIRDVDHRLPGGAGIMLDDVIAGVYAMLVLWLAARFLPTF